MTDSSTEYPISKGKAGGARKGGRGKTEGGGGCAAGDLLYRETREGGENRGLHPGGGRGSVVGMKAADDIQAKVRFWAAEASRPGFRPRPCPVPENLPRFSPQRFSSYAELNAWKHGYLLEIARQGGVKWKRSLPD